MFVSEDYLKENTPIGQNVDISKVMPWVKEVILRRIEPIMGEYFLKKITERYESGTTTAEDDKVIEKMRIAIAWGSAAEAAVNTSLKMKNKGMQKQFGDFSNSAEFDEVQFTFDNYRSAAKFHEQRLKKYVCDNSELYPEASDKKNKDGEVYNCCKCGKDNDEFFNDSIMLV